MALGFPELLNSLTALSSSGASWQAVSAQLVMLAQWSHSTGKRLSRQLTENDHTVQKPWLHFHLSLAYPSGTLPEALRNNRLLTAWIAALKEE